LLGENLSVMYILALPTKHRCYTTSPGLLNRGQDTQLVVHQDVMFRWVKPLDVIQRLFFVNVDKHVAVYGFEDARAFDLAWLEHHVAVRENDRLPPRAEPLKHVERSGIETIGERVVHQECRHSEQVTISRVLEA